MPHYDDQPQDRREPTAASFDFVNRYVGVVTLISGLLILAIFLGFYKRSAQLIEDQLLHEARAFFKEIVQTRHWIIKQGGVYIKHRLGMQPDLNLEKIKGLKTTITDQDGERYFLLNHAVVTRMISALGQQENHFAIDITSLKPLNPANQPDGFEQAALESFEAGTREYFQMNKKATPPMFRYMAPLITLEECLACHGVQGYEIGDVRGGISISIPAQRVMQEITTSRFYTMIAVIALLSVLLSVIFYISRHFINDLKKSQKRLVELAITDALTGILNRGEGIGRFQQEISRSLRKQQPLSIILIDIDYFKKINDNFGHQAGDQVLRLIAGRLAAALRNYDIICRYGGEEFLVVLPGTGLPEAIETAERLRALVANATTTVGKDGATVELTISLGVSGLQPGDSLDGLLYRADNALYIAKEEGRNQVQFIS